MNPLPIILASLLAPFAHASEPFVMVKDGKAQCIIVTSESPSPVEQQAARELTYWIGQITGETLAIQSEGVWDGKTPAVFIGHTQAAKRAQWDSGLTSPEQARVIIGADSIALLGNDSPTDPRLNWKGSYYAVLELLKKRLGVRWIWPGSSGEVFTPSPTITLEPGQWDWKPSIPLARDFSVAYNPHVMDNLTSYGIKIPQQEWTALRAEEAAWLNRQRMGWPSHLRFGHAFTKWWDRFGDSHPDWFARPPAGVQQQGGPGVKLNLSSIEVEDQIIKDWLADRQKDPAKSQYLSVCPNDSRGYDTRPATRAMDSSKMAELTDSEIWSSERAVLSDRYARFWNRLADRLKAVDPSATLTTYAYRNYQKPPQEVDLRDNIIIGYVGGEGYYPDEPFIVPEWTAWAKRGARMFWRPNLFNAGHAIPYLFSQRLFEDFRALEAQKMQGTFFDSLTGNWAGQGLNYYVAAELHNRPDVDYETLANEYFAAFGPAENAVKEYHLFFETLSATVPSLMKEKKLVPRETWGGWHRGYIEVVPLVITPEVIGRANALLSIAEQEVQDRGTPAEIARVAVLRAGLEQAELTSSVFAKLGLGRGQQLPLFDTEESKSILAPLWESRMQNLTHFALGVPKLLLEEQRQIGLWSAFISPVESKPALRIPLSEGWKFKHESSDQAPSSPQEWTSIEIEKPWRDALKLKPEVFPGKQVVWYTIDFSLPEGNDLSDRFVLRFESVDAELKGWVNGKRVVERTYPHQGDYDSWMKPFEVDITAARVLSGKNQLTLRIESDRANAGVTGKVWLISAP